MYYRVANQVGPSLTGQWKSTALSELSALFQFLRLYAAFPHDCLRVFSSTSREEMNEQLVRENQGLIPTCVLRCSSKMREVGHGAGRGRAPVVIYTTSPK